MADKGWTIEYVVELTYRQVACLTERYWARKMFEFKLMLKTNPFAGGGATEGETLPDGTQLIDATTDGGLVKMEQKGFSVKKLPT